MIPEINLLPTYERPNPKYLVIFTVLLSVWILLVTFVSVQYILTVNEQKTLDTQLRSLSIERDILQTKLLEQNNQSSIQQASIGDTYEYLQFLAVPTSGLIDEVNQLIPSGGVMESYSFSIGQISIETRFDSLNAVATFINQLESAPIFSTVVTNTISADTRGEREVYTVGFQLSINQEYLIQQYGGERIE